MTRTTFALVGIPLCLSTLLFAEQKAAKEPSGKPLPQGPVDLQAKNWDEPFAPVNTLYGSYSSLIRRGEKHYEFWNNTIGDGPEDGIVRFVGTSPTEFGEPKVEIPHRIIDDVMDKEGKLSDKRRYTRPSVVYHPRDGYFAVAHVCDGYPPRDGSVYPAFLTSKTGEAGTWSYHGRLKGEIYDEFAPGKSARWADGRGLFYQPKRWNRLYREKPLKNRFLFFSNQYPGSGCLALLYSADGKQWSFHRQDDKIVNLLPTELQGKGMIFPHVIRAGKKRWFCWLSEKWPPVAIWRIHSDDGLNWKLFGDNQPEIVKPEGAMIKNLSAWYDPEQKVIHGYVGVWSDVGGGTHNYRAYHSTTRQGL